MIERDLTKLARQVLAGVSVGLDLGDPRDIGTLAYQMNPDLYKKFGRDVDAEADGSDYFKYEGIINVYVNVDNPEEIKPAVEKVVKAWMSKMKGFRFGKLSWDKSSFRGTPVLRVRVTDNPDSELAEMMSSQMTYSTWGSILARLQRFGGLSEKHDGMSGSMPIREFVKAAREVTLTNDKESRFIDQIIRMIKVGLKRGAKELRWG